MCLFSFEYLDRTGVPATVRPHGTVMNCRVGSARMATFLVFLPMGCGRKNVKLCPRAEEDDKGAKAVRRPRRLGLVQSVSFAEASRADKHQKEIPRFRLHLQSVTQCDRRLIAPRMRFFSRFRRQGFECHGRTCTIPANYSLLFITRDFALNVSCCTESSMGPRHSGQPSLSTGSRK